MGGEGRQAREAGGLTPSEGWGAEVGGYRSSHLAWPQGPLSCSSFTPGPLLGGLGSASDALSSAPARTSTERKRQSVPCHLGSRLRSGAAGTPGWRGQP